MWLKASNTHLENLAFVRRLFVQRANSESAGGVVSYSVIMQMDGEPSRIILGEFSAEEEAQALLDDIGKKIRDGWQVIDLLQPRVSPAMEAALKSSISRR